MDHAHPDVSIIPFNGQTPRIDPSAFIAPGCRIIGDVEIGPEASIWYNCVIRADVNFIRIGARTNIQDGTVIHCDSDKDGSGGFPTTIGHDVLVGHMVMLHGCTLLDRAFVGMGSTVMDGCVVEGDAMLAAGALLTPGKRVGHRQLWTGRPARYARDLDDLAVTTMRTGVENYVHHAHVHKGAVKATA
jgi:carbonic anhydrase/acetyltransferase-like protein (isoleucine patch superfamily)